MRVSLDKDIVKSDIVMKVHDPEIDLGVSAYISENKCWEPFETSIFVELVREVDSFIDVGANIGYYSMLASRLMSKDAKVMSFEPEPGNFSLLTENISLNSLPNVQAVNMACTESEGGGSIVLSSNNFGDHRVVGEVDSGNATVSISTTTLDVLVDSMGKLPGLIKLDTQGSELTILKGMQRTLSESTDKLCMLVEYWPHGISERGESCSEFLDFLSSYEFSMCAIFEESGAVLACGIDDLRRWTDTLMPPESMRYINLLIWGKDCSCAQKVFDRFSSRHEQSMTELTQPSVIAEGVLNPALVPLGWSYPEESGVWTEGGFAEIVLHVPDPNTGWRAIQLELYPYICNGESQILNVSVNGSGAGSYTLNEEKFYQLEIEMDHRWKQSKTLIVSLEILQPHSPVQCDGSPDERALGVFLKGFSLIEDA